MKPNYDQFWVALVAAFLAAWIPASTLASPPYVNYQGTINDASGNPIHNPSQPLEFNIYTAPSGGSRVWGPFSLTAPVLNGRFNVILGPSDTGGRSLDIVFAASDERYLEIRVGSTTIAPRQRFLANPYAYSATAIVNDKVEITQDVVRIKGNTPIEFGAGTPKGQWWNGLIDYQPELLSINGGGTEPNKRSIRLGGDVEVINVTQGDANLTVHGSGYFDIGVVTPFITGGQGQEQITPGRLVDMSKLLGQGTPPLIVDLKSPQSSSFNTEDKKLVDLASYLDDDDGCRIRVYVQYEAPSDDYVRVYELVLFAERPGFSNNRHAGVDGQTWYFGDRGYAANWTLNPPQYAQHLWQSADTDVAISTYAPSSVGGSDTQLTSGFKVWFWQQPWVSTRFIIYDN